MYVRERGGERDEPVLTPLSLFLSFDGWLIVFYGISTLVGHLKPNPVNIYTYIKYL